MNASELLRLVCRIGYHMLSSGGEIYRVEETVQRICAAYGMPRADVFAVPSSLIVSITDQDEETYTKLQRLHNKTNDLEKVDRLNDLSRRLCNELPDFETAMAHVSEIENMPHYPLWVLCIAHGFAAMVFAMFFGGSFRDGLWAFPIGVMIKLTSHWMQQLGANSFFSMVLQAGISAVFALVGANYGLAEHYNTVLMGAIMNLVPGLMLTNAMRDIMAGDFIAGLTRVAEAVLIGTGIAVGVMVPLTIFRALGGVMG